jgi:hypothetical protein
MAVGEKVHVPVSLCRSFALIAGLAPLAAAQSTAERGRDAFFRNQIDSAVVLFTLATREQPNDARIHAWLAEAALRAGKPADAARAAGAALRLNPCSAPAHAVRAGLFMPRFAAPGQANDDSTWVHLTRAVECDSSDGNTWTDVWKYAIMRRDTVMEARALRAFIDSGFLTRPQLTYAEWLLRSLPPHAVLLTGGDLDTYAPLAVQAVRSVRQDVAVVNVVMLSATWYSRPILERYQLPYDSRSVSDPGLRGAQRIVAWLRRGGASGALARPVAFALTVPADSTSHAEVLQLAGPYRLVMPPSSARTDSTRINAALRDADNLDWRGPATALGDRSPVRRLYEVHPALVVARIPVLEAALAPSSSERSRDRERWVASFLTRAGIHQASIDRVLEQLRAPKRR